MHKRISKGAVFGCIIGIALVCVGAYMFLHTPITDSICHSSEIALSYSFGADFYTEIYGVTHDILSQLNNMSSDFEANLRIIYSGILLIYCAISVLISALGISVFAISLGRVRKYVYDDKTLRDLLDKNVSVNEQIVAALKVLNSAKSDDTHSRLPYDDELPNL